MAHINFYDFKLSLAGNKITYTYYINFVNHDKSWTGKIEFIFNPVNIKPIAETENINFYNKENILKSQNSVSEMGITFDGEVVRTNYSAGSEHESYLKSLVGFYFDKTEPQNFNRLKNAFLHLKDLLKAEGDPFDN